MAAINTQFWLEEVANNCAHTLASLNNKAQRKKEITENLISSFHEAGNISLELRKKGLKKEIKKTIHQLPMEILKLII